MPNDPLVTEFLEESLDSLTELDERIAALSDSQDLVNDVNEIFRPVHSIKGASSFFKLTGMMSLAHKLETLLDELRKFERQMSKDISDTLNKGFFVLREVVQNGLNDNFELSTEANKFIEELEHILDGDLSPEEYAKQILDYINSGDENLLAKAGSLLYTALGIDEPTSEIRNEDIENIEKLLKNELSEPNPDNIQNIKVASEAMLLELKDNKLKAPLSCMEEFYDDFCALADSPIGIDEMLSDVLFDKLTQVEGFLVVEPTIEKENIIEKSADTGEPAQKQQDTPTQAKKGTRSESIRINVLLLEDIMNLMSELVLSRNQLNLHASNIDNSDLSKTTQQVSTIMTELQGKVMKTRLQPVSTVFNPLPGVVREISRTLGKEVDLVLNGKTTELDRSILESIKDPLTHIIRNSLDHGLEFPDERKEAGKKGNATLTISAYHEGGMIIIEIADNGRGVNLPIVCKKAIENGLYSEAQINKLSDKQKAEIIFKAGFSTAETISQVSGRGVGMDVVCSNIEAVGGNVDLESKTGEGTILKLQIPLTLAIIPALIVESNDKRYAISQANLEEMLLLKPEEKDLIERVQGVEVFRLRGKVIPLIRLNHILGFKDKQEVDKSTNIVVLSTGKKSFGLIVDKLHDIEEIVVKSLDDYFQSTPIFSGATIMGDGSVSLIFDVIKMAAMTGMSDTSSQMIESNTSIATTVEESSQVLIFNISENTSFGVIMDNVVRLEKIKTTDIDQMGSHSYLRYREGILPLVSSWEVFDVDENVMPENMNIILFMHQEQEVGLLVRQIDDVVTLNGHIKTDLNNNPKFIGSSIIKGKVMSLLDLPYLAMTYTANESRRENLLVYQTGSELNSRISNLIESGYAVTEVHSKEEADSAFANQNVDVVVLDADLDADHQQYFSDQLETPGKGTVLVQMEKSESSEKDYQTKLSKGQLSNALNQILQARLNE